MDCQANIQEVYTIPCPTVTQEWIHNMFTDVIENQTADEEAVSQYFSKDFVQYVNGHTLNYDDFVEHIRALKAAIHSVKYTIERCMIQGNSFFTIHRVDAINNKGEEVIARIIAYFEVKEGKIVLCDEMTKLLAGSKEEEDLGSRK